MHRYLALGMNAAAFAGEGPVKIGVLGDSSSVYANIGGKGSIEAVKMAVEDAGPALGGPVEVISADHQNKADVGSNIARRWFDEDEVDVIADLPNSAVALAVIQVGRREAQDHLHRRRIVRHYRTILLALLCTMGLRQLRAWKGPGDKRHQKRG